MKFIILGLLLVSLFTSCKNDKKKISEIYSLIRYSKGSIDTIEINKPFFHNSKEDSLLSSTCFFYNNKNHFIRMYSNEKTCADDAEHILYELDSIGVIYAQSTAWHSYSRLYCNNETKKQLIDIALDIIIGSIKLKREYIQTLYNSKIEFSEPK
jgi:hypothetical protein